ncbi:MAG TPA: DUF4351 domain-containing protein [Telluria sp.]
MNDYIGKIDELLTHENVFALVTAAHLLTQQTKGHFVKRLNAKRRFARLLFERKWDRQRILDLFNILDWMMRLPEGLQTQLMSDIEELEREYQMPYISSFERRGLERGRAEGRAEGLEEGRQKGKTEFLVTLLERRFGPLPLTIANRVMSATPAELEAWSGAILDAPTLDALFAR